MEVVQNHVHPDEVRPHQLEIRKGVVDKTAHALYRSHSELCRERVQHELVVLVLRIGGVHQEFSDRALYRQGNDSVQESER